MERTTLKPYFIVIALLVITITGLGVTVDIRVTDEAGIHLGLPDKVGEWEGTEMRFCQNPTCLKEVATTSSFRPESCPTCGSPLSMMTLAEKNLLPLDTVLLKKRYHHPSGRNLYCTIVLSGKDRASIHRPEVCLVGQGRKITDQQVLTIPMDARPNLKVKVLDLLYTPRQVGNTPPPKIGSYYAYWFVGKNRETPYHWERMVWMGFDRVFKNVAHKWAYISVGGGRDRANMAYKDEIQSFVSELYPQIVLF